MRETPLLYKAEMVNAVLDDRKIHTRRIVNLDRLQLIPRRTIGSDIPFQNTYGTVRGGRKTKAKMNAWGAVRGKSSTGEWLGLKPDEFDFVCPYADGHTYLGNDNKWHIGVTDSQLWVRESWAAGKGYDGLKPSLIPALPTVKIWYSADGDKPEWAGKTRPSIFMPRWMSRIQLDVTGVRIERLQDIGDDDVWAEGISKEQYEEWLDDAHNVAPPGSSFESPVDQFERLWDSINGKPRKDGTDISWKADPWLWVIEFKRINKGATS